MADGSHAYDGDLGKTGLKLVDERGRSITWPGVALRERGHFAAAVVVPHDGAWTLIGLQGFFPEYKVGTLTVPGPLRVLSPPALAHGHKGDWGAVRPQIVDSEHAAAGHTHAGPPEAATGAVGEDAPRERDAVPLMPALVVGLTLVVLLAVGWVLHAKPAAKGRYGLPGGQADLRHPSMWGMLVDRLPYQPSGAYPLRLAETPASAAARSSTPPA